MFDCPTYAHARAAHPRFDYDFEFSGYDINGVLGNKNNTLALMRSPEVTHACFRLSVLRDPV